MIHILPGITANAVTEGRDLRSRPVHDSPFPERKHLWRSTNSKQWMKDFHRLSIPSPMSHLVLTVTPETLAEYGSDVTSLPTYGESAEKCSFVEPTIGRARNIDGPDPPSVELCKPTNGDDAYVDLRGATDLSHIRCVTLKRRTMAVLEMDSGCIPDQRSQGTPGRHQVTRGRPQLTLRSHLVPCWKRSGHIRNSLFPSARLAYSSTQRLRPVY